MEQHNGEFPSFSFYLIHPSFRVERDGKSETPMGTDEKSANKPVLSSQKTMRRVVLKDANSQLMTTYLKQAAQKRLTHSYPHQQRLSGKLRPPSFCEASLQPAMMGSEKATQGAGTSLPTAGNLVFPHSSAMSVETKYGAWTSTQHGSKVMFHLSQMR